MKPYQSTNKAYSKFNQSRALSLWIIREGRLGEGRLSDFSIANFTPLTHRIVLKLKILVRTSFFYTFQLKPFFQVPQGRSSWDRHLTSSTFF